MANIKISAMTSLSSVTDSTTFPVVDSGTNYKITASQLKTYIGAGSSYSNTNVSAYLTANPPTGTYSNSNVASYLPTFSGNITSGNANLGNAVTANYFIGNGSQLTGLPAGYSNTNVASYLSSNPQTGTYSNTNVSSYLSTYSSYMANATHATVADSANAVTWSNVSSTPTTISGYGITDAYSNSNVASYLPTYGGNIAGGNISITGNISAGNIHATGSITYTTTTNQNITDNKITLNSGTSGAPTLSASIVIDRGSSASTSIRWNESTQVWDQTRDGTTFYTLPINTTELAEGTNLYFTTARSNTAFDNRLATKSTTNLAEGTNLYYTDTRANTAFDNRLAVKTTDNLTQGSTNKYFTNALARAAISVTGSGSYDNTTGIITVTGGVTSVNTKTGAVTLTTNDIGEGTNLYFTTDRANTAMAAFTGNLTSGNANLGNLTKSNYFSGNGSLLTSITGANITGWAPNANNANYLGGVVATSYLQTTGTGSSLTSITGANVTGQVANALIAGTVYTAAQPNITSVGTLSSLAVTANANVGNINSSGVANITGNLTAANANLGNLVVANYHSGNGSLLTSITGANVTGQVGNALVAGTVYTNAQPNITSVGTLTSLLVGNSTANANIGNATIVLSATGNANLGNLVIANYHQGVLTTAAQPNITSVGTLSSLAVTANITAGNINAGNLLTANYSTSVLTTAAQPNITSVGTLTSLTVSGNTSANNANITNYLYVGSAVSNLYKTVPLTVAGANAGNTITGINIVNTGGGTGSGSGIDFYTYTGAGYPPEASIYSVDNGDYSANINFATKVPGAGANILATRMTVASNGNVVIPGNLNVGNVIVNGQPTTYGVVNPAYMVVGLATSIGGFGNGSTVILDTVVGNVNSQASYNASTGVFTLVAGVTYDMSFTPSFISFSNTTGGYMCYEWVDATTNSELDTTGTGVGTSISSQDTTAQQDNATARVIYTPSTNQTVKLRVNSANGTATLRGSIGTQAIVRPLNLSIAVQATATGTVAKNYAKYVRTTAQTGVSAGTVVICSTLESSSGTAISVNTSTGQVTLTAGTYRLRGTIGSFSGSAASALIGYSWYNETTSAYIGEGAGFNGATSTAWNASGGGTAEAVITVASTAVVSFRVVSVSNTSSIGGTGADFGAPYAYPWIDIEQMGATFALNALDTMTTTGNVSVGGNLTVTGGIRKSARVLTTTTTLTVADASGFIEFAGSGTYTVTLPDPTQAANSGIGYRFWQNTSQNITLSTPAGNFYGPSGSSASTKVLAQATTQYWDVWSDGYNWVVFGIKTV